jgi:hypothetical protein
MYMGYIYDSLRVTSCIAATSEQAEQINFVQTTDYHVLRIQYMLSRAGIESARFRSLSRLIPLYTQQ